MRIAREESFGPVLSILPYESEAQAIAMANGTEYGLAAYVNSQDRDKAEAVTRQMRAGTIYINYPDFDIAAPFGGYKRLVMVANGASSDWTSFWRSREWSVIDAEPSLWKGAGAILA
jgi:acyl-CoA reductase-like NAD-dependent aldehyde dehydrogenase